MCYLNWVHDVIKKSIAFPVSRVFANRKTIISFKIATSTFFFFFHVDQKWCIQGISDNYHFELELTRTASKIEPDRSRDNRLYYSILFLMKPCF